MKLFVKDNQNISETEVEIRCQNRDEEVENLVNAINLAGNTLMGEKENGDKTPVYVSKILYIEAVDRNVFAYTPDEIYRIKRTLFDLEEVLSKEYFTRISKSSIVNLKSVRKISPDDSRRLKLLLKNGEWIMVSRNYVSDFKKSIGMNGEK